MSLRSHGVEMKAALLACVLVLAGCPQNGTGDGDAGEAPDASDVTPDAGPDAGPDDAGPGDGGDVDAGPAPVVMKLRGVSPARGPLEGGALVLLNGRGFVDGFADTGGVVTSAQTTITFGGNTALDINVIDDDTVEVRVPPGAPGDSDVALTNPNGTITCTGCYTYFAAIELSRVTPTSGTTRGGDAITLLGKNFLPGMLVLVGGSEATDVSVSEDGTSLTARTPPGTAGSADVGVVGPSSTAFLRRGFVFVDPITVSAVVPVAGALAGGDPVVVTGVGFPPDAALSIGGSAATRVEWISPTELHAVTPAGSGAGPADVVVTSRRGTGTLLRGFAYIDPEARDTALHAVTPTRGDPAGQPCTAGASTCIVLRGAGFDAGELSVRIGDAEAEVVRVIDSGTVEVALPPGAPGLVDVQVRTLRGGAVLERAFAYVPVVSVTAIDPAAAPASGSPAVTATLSGAGFASDCTVHLGANVAPVVSASDDGTSLVVTAPVGSPGDRDVRVSCGDPTSPFFREAVLVKGFRFTTTVRLLQVEPAIGAIAGNTAVAIYGAGFDETLNVRFGSAFSPSVEVKGPNLAIVRTPRGDPGTVNVLARTHDGESVLRGGFNYVDPANILGGASGGPMNGILNVTVLIDAPGVTGPVPGATISINNDALVGLTDDRGQVTFSDPLLLKPVTITASRADFAASTLARLDARNVTLFMQPTGQGEPSDPPPPPEPATLAGRVCGFKVPPGFQLADGQRLEARVYMSAQYVYAAPPFRQLSTPALVLENCGVYQIQTRRYGPLALYAEFGIADTTASPPTFQPLLMGIKRGLEAQPGVINAGLDVILDMHRDVSVPINIQGAAPPPGSRVMNSVYSYLDLGGEGVIPLAQQDSEDDEFLFERHPRVSGDGVIFLNFAQVVSPLFGTPGPPYSFFYRRQFGDLAAGLEIGPMLAFTRLTTPTQGGMFSGTLAWQTTQGQAADFQQVIVEQPMGLSSVPVWDIVLPGTERSVALPSSALTQVPRGATIQWTVITARSPRFDFDRFGYQQLGVNAWTSFTEDFSSFNTP